MDTATDTAVSEGQGAAPDTAPTTEAPASPEGVTSEGAEGQGVADTDVTDSSKDVSGPESDSPSTEHEEKPTEKGDPGEAPQYFYNGEAVSVHVPDDLKSHLDSAGVDVDSVVAELYSKDGDFTLSEETRKPLDDKYGRPIVDTFLSALKSQNDNFIKGQKDAQAKADAANQAAIEWSNELVGGEENWTALETWATDNLSDEQFNSFNRAMASGDKWLQELAIKDLHSKMKQSEGDASADLISGDRPSNDAGSALTAEQYKAEMRNPEFLKLGRKERIAAQQKLDARRRAGMKKGI